MYIYLLTYLLYIIYNEKVKVRQQLFVQNTNNNIKYSPFTLKLRRTTD